MSDLRSLLPTRIVHGALLRPDGVAVGLIRGAAPAWDLLSVQARAQLGLQYHRILLSLHEPVDIYVLDDPPDLSQQLSLLTERQIQAQHPAHAAILGDLIEELLLWSQQTTSRQKQVIWAVTAAASAQRQVRGVSLQRLLTADWHRGVPQRVSADTALAQAVAKSRRLEYALHVLNGSPPPRLLEPEEIARLVYQQLDPVRAQRYPLSGSLLERVRLLVGSPGQVAPPSG